MFDVKKFSEFLLDIEPNQSELARKTGYTRAYISYFVNGHSKTISDEFIERLAKGTKTKRELCYAMAGKLTPEARNNAVKNILDQYK